MDRKIRASAHFVDLDRKPRLIDREDSLPLLILFIAGSVLLFVLALPFLPFAYAWGKIQHRRQERERAYWTAQRVGHSEAEPPKERVLGWLLRVDSQSR